MFEDLVSTSSTSTDARVAPLSGATCDAATGENVCGADAPNDAAGKEVAADDSTMLSLSHNEMLRITASNEMALAKNIFFIDLGIVTFHYLC
jgi:hypothetical protein